jgi:rubrerythrin
MSHSETFPTFDELDADGAIREAASRVDPVTRASFLRRAAAVTAGGGLVASMFGAGALTAVAGAQSGGLPKADVNILNYALTLEYLEAAFYKEAVGKAGLTGALKTFGTTVAAHEAAHVQALKKTLGAKAVKKPSFDFKGTTAKASTFAQTAKVLEDTGVEAYQGQATNIKTPAVLKAAISIHPVEARHAAWIASILGKGSGSPSPAPDAFNPAEDMATILAAVKQTGFIAGSARAAAADPPMSGQPQIAG